VVVVVDVVVTNAKRDIVPVGYQGLTAMSRGGHTEETQRQPAYAIPLHMEASPTNAELYAAILDLGAAVNDGFGNVERRFSSIDRQFGEVHARISDTEHRLNARIDNVREQVREEMRAGFAAVDRRLSAVEAAR
jgi:hypothetical protein